MYRQSEKKLLNSNTSSTCPHNMMNFGLLTAEICWRVWGTPKFQRVSRLGSVTSRHSSSKRQPNFAALNRGRQLHSAGRPPRWALAHISSCIYHAVSAGLYGKAALAGIPPATFWEAGAAPVRDECRRPYDLLHVEVQACHSAASSMAQSLTAD